jgi:uncharacterized protein (DUF4415 family)
MTATTRKKIPAFKTDKARQFIAKADLSKYDLKGRPMSEVFPQFASQMKGRGRPALPVGKRKVHLTLRLPPEVVDYYRSFGPGWHSKISETLQRAVHKKTSTSGNSVAFQLASLGALARAHGGKVAKSKPKPKSSQSKRAIR